VYEQVNAQGFTSEILWIFRDNDWVVSFENNDNTNLPDTTRIQTILATEGLWMNLTIQEVAP
jgi:hypothetical protein